MNTVTTQRAGKSNPPSGGEVRGDAAGPPMPFEPAYYREWKAERAACSGYCEQGRKPCATPEACRLPDDFGAVGAITKLWPALLTAWALIVALVAFFWLVTP